MVGPFTFLDHLGPVSDQRLTVLPHPHIGLATLTYLFEGEVVHRDTLGNTQAIRPREVNWMVAGRGIAHSERATDATRMHMVQAWIALPEEAEEVDPGFTHLDEPELPSFEDGGARAQLLSGEAYGLASSAPSYSRHFYVAVRLAPGATMALPSTYSERAAYVARGKVRAAESSHDDGRLVVFGAHHDAVVEAVEDSDVLFLGGEPIGKRFMWWNFVSSRRERIDRAKEDWKAGRIALPPDDDREFVPLPHDSWPKPKPEPEPMS